MPLFLGFLLVCLSLDIYAATPFLLHSVGLGYCGNLTFFVEGQGCLINLDQDE